MVTMNDVIAFVEKAMENNLDIKVMSNVDLKIYKSDGEHIIFWLLGHDLAIDKPRCNEYRIENISELDLSAYNYLLARVKEYSINKTLEYFDTFFKEENSKLTDINDLDDKED